MKNILIIFILLITISTSGQDLISKEAKICNVASSSLASLRIYNNGSLVSDKVIFTGRNRQYTHIVDMFAILKASPDEMLDFLDFAIKFYDNEKGTGTIKNDVYISVDYSVGTKYLQLTVDGKFEAYSLNQLTKLRNKLQAWINEQAKTTI